MVATLFALFIANSQFYSVYDNLFHNTYIFGHFNLHMIVDDFLMAIFFFVIGLEIKLEMMYGNLSSFKKASFPILASFGGVVVPAIIFIAFNLNTTYLSGIGIPISTDIAFAIGIFSIFKSKLNPSLKIFLLSLAVVDDLISIVVIGSVYSSNINYTALAIAAAILLVLLTFNKVLKIKNALVYLSFGLVLWYCIYISGIHATISGVLLALCIPSTRVRGKKSLADKLEHILSPLSNLIILPLFAFANTAITLSFDFSLMNSSNLMLGIICGLVIGKPLGVMLFSFIATKLQIAQKPKNTSWLDIFEVSLLTGIGFTMSIFVAEIAFTSNPEVVDLAKMSILAASLISVLLTHFILNFLHRFISPPHKKHVFAPNANK